MYLDYSVIITQIILRAVKNSFRGMRQLVKMNSLLETLSSQVEWNINEQWDCVKKN